MCINDKEQQSCLGLLELPKSLLLEGMTDDFHGNQRGWICYLDHVGDPWFDDGLPYSHDRGYISPIQYWIVEVYVAVHAYFLMSFMFTSILRISLKPCSG